MIINIAETLIFKSSLVLCLFIFLILELIGVSIKILTKETISIKIISHILYFISFKYI